ncbi:hypothetical protein DFR58_1582 [Anaerobacterium chartisolvens]|uniref:Uncharacterized protein n=1 Tax=Anaerobacterium chartisolvens TaxID=1297424 RepID=A0A369AD72_9FIRM|nr:hypothetical protein [Anaerobacterium chartisolvens]RCX07131.1 hypothetical protein DFR58_1582 [Anaerobacterium chartisolvens]
MKKVNEVMNLKKNNRLYQLIKDTNYIIFFIAYVVICSILVIIFEVSNTLFIKSDIMVRFELGLPIILQLILTYTVHRENQEIRIIKILFKIVFLYTLVCGALSLYELSFTYPSFVDDLVFHISKVQIVFQSVLAALLFICLIAKQVNKLVTIKPLIMTLFTILIVVIMQFGNKVIDSGLPFWIILITLFINIFNPVLLYILSYIAKGKLFRSSIESISSPLSKVKFR